MSVKGKYRNSKMSKIFPKGNKIIQYIVKAWVTLAELSVVECDGNMFENHFKL